MLNKFHLYLFQLLETYICQRVRKIFKSNSYYIEKGRVAFLLKKSRPSKFERKEAKKYTANLNVQGLS